MEYRELAGERSGEPSASIRQRVQSACTAQQQRFRDEPFFSNARMSIRHVRRHCALDREGEALLRQAMEGLGLSARAYTKILKVARTIADLEGADAVRPHHLTETVNCRTLDRVLE